MRFETSRILDPRSPARNGFVSMIPPCFIGRFRPSQAVRSRWGQIAVGLSPDLPGNCIVFKSLLYDPFFKSMYSVYSMYGLSYC